MSDNGSFVLQQRVRSLKIFLLSGGFCY